MDDWGLSWWWLNSLVSIQITALRSLLFNSSSSLTFFLSPPLTLFEQLLNFSSFFPSSETPLTTTTTRTKTKWIWNSPKSQPPSPPSHARHPSHHSLGESWGRFLDPSQEEEGFFLSSNLSTAEKGSFCVRVYALGRQVQVTWGSKFLTRF